jgi:hypothetical protein
MSTVKNQKKEKKSEKIRISKNNRIYFFYVEFSRNFKFTVDFLFELKYYQFLSEVNSYHTCKLIDLLKFDCLNSFYLNMR